MRRYFLRAAAIAGTGYAAAFGITLRRTKGDARRAFIRMQLAHYKLLSILMFDHDPLSLVKNSSYPKFHDIPLTLQQRVAAWFLDLDKQKPDGVTLGDVYRLIGENGGENNKPCTLKEVLEEVQKRYLLLGSAAERDIFHRHLEVESAEAFRNYYNSSDSSLVTLEPSTSTSLRRGLLDQAIVETEREVEHLRRRAARTISHLTGSERELAAKERDLRVLRLRRRIAELMSNTHDSEERQ